MVVEMVEVMVTWAVLAMTVVIWLSISKALIVHVLMGRYLRSSLGGLWLWKRIWWESGWLGMSRQK